ncbi:MAG: phosphoribosylamine--glycine ligase [Prolixibacteraceae bacterium]|jgi:phosphoribosylamine--glycine ligase|nr:phosphoribosylamine--glycine ligase [Prolixibacteraceae bacterium]
MNILIIGSGGREHALAWKLKQSSKLDNLYIAPGNAGTAALGENLAIDTTDFSAIREVVIQNRIQMVVVGPEIPLVAGIHDFFLADGQLSGIPVIGPDSHGARLEGSKEFAKEFMVKNNIPTAKYFTVHQGNLDEGIEFLKNVKAPYVLKADGLAAGKGVLIIEHLDEAIQSLQEMLNGLFGSASSTVVIEEFLSGVECSVFVLTDGTHYKILPEAKDYKRIGEGDTGLNTGGMGAISPVPFATPEFMRKVEERMVIPTISGLRRENIDFKGFIFLGLMSCEGEPYLIEYNVRMGDPETEAVMMRIQSDLVDLLEGVAQGNLDKRTLVTDSRTAVTVMVVAGGYPGNYEKGKKIKYLETVEGSVVFHAGTKLDGEMVLTNGGRVLAVSSLAGSMDEALALSYKNTEKIFFEKMYYRTDLGFDLK